MIRVNKRNILRLAQLGVATLACLSWAPFARISSAEQRSGDNSDQPGKWSCSSYEGGVVLNLERIESDGFSLRPKPLIWKAKPSINVRNLQVHFNPARSDSITVANSGVPWAFRIEVKGINRVIRVSIPDWRCDHGEFPKSLTELKPVLEMDGDDLPPPVQATWVRDEDENPLSRYKLLIAPQKVNKQSGTSKQETKQASTTAAQNTDAARRAAQVAGAAGGGNSDKPQTEKTPPASQPTVPRGSTDQQPPSNPHQSANQPGQAGGAPAGPPLETRIVLRADQLRIVDLVSAQVLRDGTWTDLLSQDSLRAVRLDSDLRGVGIPVDAKNRQHQIKIGARTYFQSGPKTPRLRYFCFSADAATVNIDEAERLDGCLSAEREVKLVVKAEGRQISSGFRIIGDGPRGRDAIDLSQGVLKGRDLAEKLVLRDNQDYQDGTWPVDEKATEVTVELKAKEQNIRLAFQDEGNRNVSETLNVSVSVLGLKGIALPDGRGGEYSVRMPAVRGDRIEVEASGPSYEPSPESYPLDPSQRRVLHVRTKPEEVVVRLWPYYKNKGEKKPADAVVDVSYTRVVGEDHAPANFDRQQGLYAATIQRRPRTGVTIALANGSAHGFLASDRYPLTAEEVKLPRNELEMHFARPIVTVMLNANERLSQSNPTQRGGFPDLKQEVWGLFDDLGRGDLVGRFGFRYFALMQEGQPPRYLVSQEETLIDLSEARRPALDPISAHSAVVPPATAIRSFGEFLDGFSYAPSAPTRGVLVYVLGGGTEVLDPQSPVFDQLEKQAVAARVRVLVVQFVPARGEARDKLLSDRSRHRDLRYLEFSMEEESQDYFRRTFQTVKSTLLELLEIPR